jgi:rSAM/selenodomain-associated transferase 1
LLRHALATASAAAPARVELWCAPDITHPALIAAAQACGATLHIQHGDDLGARMANAFTSALQRTPHALCIGTDCPALTTQHLNDAAAALRANHDAVFVPAEDGGYTLVGLSRNEPRVFDNVTWSSEHVMQQTRERARACGLRWHELETLWDVDRPEDWQRLQQSGLLDATASPS